MKVPDWYSVTVEARSPSGVGHADDDTLERFASLLAPHHGTASGGPDRWAAQISVQANTISVAADRGIAIARSAAWEAGYSKPWPVVVIEAVREDILDERLAKPVLPELVSGPEAAAILGVSNQRLHQLAATHSRFPQPVYRLRAARVWLRAAIVKFAEEWDRKPGRPRKTDQRESLDRMAREGQEAGIYEATAGHPPRTRL